MRRARIALALVCAVAAACESGPPPTWNGDIASIVHEHCAACHRPEGIAPFSVLAYESAAGRARRMAEMVESGAMPPWPPEGGEVHFANERGLSAAEREAIVRWAEAGAPRGSGSSPPPPRFADGWTLGEPDLVVRPPRAFELGAGEEDVFRNLVIPVPIDSTVRVRTVDLRPGSPGNVHHAILYVDDAGAARRADSAAAGPGFPGMDVGSARIPEGSFVGWTPGKAPFEGRPDVAWKLEPGMDLVLQLHMMPSDEPRTIRPEVGIYFADRAPERSPVVVKLWRNDLDIPAGESDYRVEDRFRLPVAAEALSVYPHAHYLGREVRGYAVLPDGEERELIHIPEWDFMWQDQYFFAEPVALPAGSEIVMEWHFDNTADNPRNPNETPRRVRYGNRSTDEMAELSVQLLTRRERDRWALVEARAEHALRKGGGWREHFNLARAARERGDIRTAVREYRRALEGKPDLFPAHYNLGNVLLAGDDAAGAEAHFLEAARLSPERPDVWHNLGYARELQGRVEAALEDYATALDRDPAYAPAHHAIGNLRFARGDVAGAIEAYREAVRVDPRFADGRVNLGNALGRAGRSAEAIDQYRAALRFDPDHVYGLYNLAVALRETGDRAGAVESLERVVEIAPGLYPARLELARLYAATGRRDAAIREYREAVRLAGQDSEAGRELRALPR